MPVKQNHLDLTVVREIILKIAEYFHIKLIVGYLFLVMAWLFNGEYEVLLSIYLLLIFDTITGIWAVIKVDGIKGMTSRDFFRLPRKFFVYTSFLLVARLADKNFPLAIAAPLMDAFVASTECISILENFAKLGSPVPLTLINKLKDIYKKV